MNFNNENIKDDFEISLRPKRLIDYIGQKDIKETLHIFIQTAIQRQETLDHVLLYGPPGLGKTTLANIIAHEMGGGWHSVTAPSIDRVGDLVAILSSLEAGDILFIDEIHRLPRVIEEVLYSAMEDYVVDIVVGKDSTANTVRIDLPPFTLIGATTRYGDLSGPLRDRFGIINNLNYYSVEELQQVVKRTSKVFNFSIDDDSSYEIAKRSRGTPRIANRLFRRVRDFAQYRDSECDMITLEVSKESLDKLNIDHSGLNMTDHKYLKAMIDRFHGGPVGINAIASSISEDVTTIEDVYEPFLLQQGFIVRTSRGRMVTEKAYQHLGVEKNESNRF